MALTIGVWLMAVLFFIYGFLLLRRQKQMIQRVLKIILPPEESKFGFRPVISEEDVYTSSSEHDTSNGSSSDIPVQKTISISKNEPLSKYKDMVVDDNTTISFVDPTE